MNDVKWLSPLIADAGKIKREAAKRRKAHKTISVAFYTSHVLQNRYSRDLSALGVVVVF